MVARTVHIPWTHCIKHMVTMKALWCLYKKKTILGRLFVIDFLVYAIMKIRGFQVSIRLAVTPIKVTEVIRNKLRSSGPDTKYLWKL